MTREHLVEDIRNVISMVREIEDGDGNEERTRRAVQGLHRHIEAESDVPERVLHCLGESIRSLDRIGAEPDPERWRYTRTCLESALEFAETERTVSS
jgi:hypothetical protein